jgi:hypothetical protein
MTTINAVALEHVVGGGAPISDCWNDGKRLCTEAFKQGGPSGVVSCMVQNKSQIRSAACKAHIK